MNEARREFLDIVTQVRTHLEYQRALGVTHIEAAGMETAAAVPRLSQTPPQKQEDAPAEIKASKPAAARASALDVLQAALAGCVQCTLRQGRKNIVFGEGNPKASLLFIGDVPAQEENGEGRPFPGAAGQLLTDIIVKGMKLRREDVYLCTIVKCQLAENRDPGPAELGACEPFLVRQLQAIKPKVIVALGDAAAALLKTSEDITTLRGAWKTYQGIPLMPTYHPAHLLRNPDDKKLVWEDIKKVMAELKKGGRTEGR